MKHFHLFSIIFFLSLFINIDICLAAKSDSVFIKEIYFLGLKRSKPDYVQHYIKTKAGTYTDTLSIRKDALRINKLSQFENTSYFLQYLGDTAQATLFFTCEEIFTLIPMVNFGGSKEDFWLRIGLKDFNLFGRGHEAIIVYQYYDKHSVMFDYKIPYLGNSKWGLSFSGQLWTTYEPYYFADERVLYNYNKNSFSLATSYEFSYENYVEFEVSPLWEHYEKMEDQDSLEGPVTYNRNSVKTRFYAKNSNIDYDFFYLKGIKNSFDMEVAYNYTHQEMFWLLYDEIKGFCRPLRTMNLAGRIRAGVASNNDSLFAPFVCDDFVNIRGSGSKVFRGTASLSFNLELRQTVFENRWAGIQAVLFNDSGSWISSGGDWSELTMSKRMQSFSGLGIRLILKKAYDTMFRADYGWDLLHGTSGGLVLGVGQYF